jgi:hypothetical protein
MQDRAAAIREIIRTLGGNAELARELGMQRRAVGMWISRGAIPRWVFDDLLDLAARHGLSLSRSELEALAVARPRQQAA